MHEDTAKTEAPRRRKPILKAPKPPTQTQKINATLQSGLQALRRDFLGGMISSAPKETNQTQVNTSHNAHNPFWRVALPVVSGPPAPASGSLSGQPFKAVRFTMSSLKVVYPLLDDAPPSAESQTRDQVNSAHRQALQTLRSKAWTGHELVQLYTECCRSKEEAILPEVTHALNPGKDAGLAPKTMDLTGLHLSLGAAEALGDVLSVDFGLRKLVLENCNLDDESVKHILHALLVSGSLPTLSLANNRKIKAKGWRFIAIFLRKAQALKFIDLSDNNLDRRAAEWLSQAIAPKQLSIEPELPSVAKPLPPLADASGQEAAPEGGLPTTNEVPRPHPTHHDSFDDHLMLTAPLLRGTLETGVPMPAALTSFRLENCNLRAQSLEAFAQAIRRSSVKHVSLRRNKITALGTVALAVMMRDYPVAADDQDISTARPTPLERDSIRGASGDSHSYPPLAGNSDALLDADEEPSSDMAYIARTRLKLLKEIAVLPRVGHLLTLDVRSNDIKSGASYIGQVLKRNRTLKVLNLSDNKIDSSGLMAIAEALKYNGSLETLDMSKNPCCGPRTDGIAALRSAFSQNDSLMRVFLAATDLTSEGAICLAEYLPEVKSLIHLDLTDNLEIEIAGVMALAVAVKMNTTIRCLDLNIPPNDPGFSRLSQEILQSCIRNTEAAQEISSAKGIKQPVSAPILKSTVARNLEASQEPPAEAPRDPSSSTARVVAAARQHIELLQEVLSAVASESSPTGVLSDILDAAHAAQFQLAEVATVLQPSELDLSRALNELCTQAEATLASKRQSPSLHPPPSPALPASPTFSIVDSDESDSEEPPPKQSLAVPLADTAPVSEEPRSPIESQVRNWLEEEAEVFRKKTYLDSLEGQNDGDEDVSGEDLKREILETEVERRPSSSPLLDLDPAVPSVLGEQRESADSAGQP